MLWFLSLAAGRGFCVEDYSERGDDVWAATPAGRIAWCASRCIRVRFQRLNPRAHEDIVQLHAPGP